MVPGYLVIEDYFIKTVKMTQLLSETNQQQKIKTKINYMNYKMLKKWIIKQEEDVEDTNGHFSSNRGHLWPAPAAQACCSFKQELQFDHEE